MTDELNNIPVSQEEERMPVFIPDYEEEEERTEEDYQKRAINSRIHLTEAEVAPREPVKMNLFQKIENFFFYYKKIVFAVVGTILAIIIGVVFPRQTPRDFEIHIYCNEQQLEMQQLTRPIDEYLSQYAHDVDGDGKGVVASECYDLAANQYSAVYDENGEYVLKEDGDPLTTPISQANPYDYVEYIATFATIGKDMNDGKIYLFLFDDLNYNILVEEYGEEIFVRFGSEHRIPLYEDEKFAQFCEENGITAKLSLCLISKNEEIESKEKLLEAWQNAYDFVETLLADCPDLA